MAEQSPLKKRSPAEGSALPRAGVVRLARKGGKFRFEKNAISELHSFLEATASDIAKRSGRLASLAKRKTITKEDVGFASTE